MHLGFAPRRRGRICTRSGRRSWFGAISAIFGSAPYSSARGIRFLDRLEQRVLLAGNLEISEFMALNSTGRADEDGQRSDWIEIHNGGAASASLQGLYLTDNPAKPKKWEFPDVTIGPDGYLVVFASGKDRAAAGGELHTSFSLDANGGYLALVASDGQTILSSYNYSQQEADISHGMDPASGGALRSFATPSPGAPNQRSEVVINEIHYDPDVKTELVEFVELYNPGSAAVDLSGASFTKGIDYTFAPGTVLAPGGYVV